MTDRGASKLTAKAHVATYSDAEAYAYDAIKLATGAAALGFSGTIGKTFHAKISRVSLDRLSIGVGKASASVTVTSGVPNAHVFMFATEPAADRRISGWTVGRHHIFHPRPGDQAFATSPSNAPWPYSVITAPFDLLDEQGPRVTGLDQQAPLNDDRLYLAPAAAMARLVSLMNDVTRIAEKTPWIAATPQPAKALAGAITDALLACLTHGRLERDRAALRRHRQIVAKLEQVMRDRPADMLCMTDICAEVGVARRTLNLACLEFLGQGATQYARARRLEHVRNTLLTSDPATTQVTRVATDFGFWELGRFAQAYRARFGERPSDTLRRNGIRTADISQLPPFHALAA
jgi:AraC-like DNA-binding protein